MLSTAEILPALDRVGLYC